MKTLPRVVLWPALCLSLAGFPAKVSAQVAITFDYSLDTGGFFADSSRKTLLQSAANAITSRLGDTLDGITPGGVNTWDAIFFHPATGDVTSVTDVTVPANTLVLYAGGRDLSGSTLGEGGPGGYSASGNLSFVDGVEQRGETGVDATDFAPWGGSIAFDSVASWYFDNDPGTSDVPGGQNDFYSVALHELAHVLGIGTATSWHNHISSALFSGANAKAANGGADVPTEADGGHWLNGTLSVLPFTATSQEAAMDPSITLGTRKVLTELDFAGLADIGWEVSPVPEPASVALIAGTGLLGLAAWRRRRG